MVHRHGQEVIFDDHILVLIHLAGSEQHSVQKRATTTTTPILQIKTFERHHVGDDLHHAIILAVHAVEAEPASRPLTEGDSP